MRLNRPQGAATDRETTARVARRRNHLGAGAIRVLSVTAVAAATCSLWAGVASAATVAPAAGTASTTTITNTSPGTTDAGVAYTINVKVTGAGGTPTGTVTIAPTDATLPASYSCTATLSGGVGSCAVTPGAGTFGDIDYTATYSGDGTFAGSASATGGFELIVPETTTTSVSPAAATTGSVTLTATVVGQDTGNISPSAGGSGTVTFYNDGTLISAACAAVSLTYDGGGANLATCATTLAAGTYTITAKYSGDPNNLASNGSETLVVSAPKPAKHATKTKGSAKPASTKVGRVVKLSATVTGGSTPTGTVTFRWQGHVVCKAKLSHGKAHCSVIFLKARTFRIRAWYGGNSTHDGSHSGLFAVKVKS